jgi:ADP-heptose:LPS heptosyltransferase
MERLKPLELGFKAFFVKMFSFVLETGRPHPAPLDADKLSKVLFLRPEKKIGDMVISLPVFDGLKKNYPHIRISVLGSPKNKALIKDDPRFDRVFMYRKNVWRDFRELLAIRREKYDCVVDLICDDSVTALFLSQFCTPGKPRIGVGKTGHRRYYDFNYHHLKGSSGHVIDGTLKLLNAFGIDVSTIDAYATPYVDQASFDLADRYLESVSNGDSRGFRIGFNLSAGAASRTWAIDKSRELVGKILSSSDDYSVILLNAPWERSRADEVKRAFDKRVYQIPPELNLTQVSALVSRLDMLISPDTSMVHVARAFKVPVVGMYCSCDWNFLFWKPYGQETGAVLSGNESNIFDITPEQVFDAFQKVVEEMCKVR